MAFAADFQRRLSLLDQGRSAEAVVEAHYEQESNVIEAAINGATAGGKWALDVIPMWMSFLGLVALTNR